jgi:ATP-binding protein involved in chromosome partitioning
MSPSSQEQVTEKQVLDVLSKVQDPELRRDVVSLGMIKNLKIEGGHVSLTLVLTTPACPLRNEFKRAVEEAVAAIPGVEKVDVELGAQVARFAGPRKKEAVPGITHIVAVASGKGGVGKSTVTVNLAAALAQAGAKTGVLDADIYGPTIPKMMGVTGEHIYLTQQHQLRPVEKDGVKLVSMAFLIEEGQSPIIWRGPLVSRAVDQMLREAEWGQLDYLLIDLPPGTGDIPLTLIQSVPLTGVVIVMTPQEVARRIAVKSLAMFQNLDVPVLGIVENMSTFICPHCNKETPIFTRGRGEETSKEMGVAFLGTIPLDPMIVSDGDSGEPTVLSHPASAVAESFRKVARAMAGRISVVSMLQREKQASSQAAVEGEIP